LEKGKPVGKSKMKNCAARENQRKGMGGGYCHALKGGHSDNLRGKREAEESKVFRRRIAQEGRG